MKSIDLVPRYSIIRLNANITMMEISVAAPHS